MSKCARGLIRVLARGGMLVAGADGHRVYRTGDARRGCVGILPDEMVARLKADRALVALCDRAERWGWREGHALPAGMVRPDAPASPKTSGSRTGQANSPRARSATVLEAALGGIEDQRARERLARAAMRFLRDYEAQSLSRSVTMNWSFELRGNKGRHFDGAAGLPERSLSARAALVRMTEILGKRRFALVECALVKQHSQRRLGTDFGMGVRGVLEALRQGLCDIAEAYDHCIRAEV